MTKLKYTYDDNYQDPEDLVMDMMFNGENEYEIITLVSMTFGISRRKVRDMVGSYDGGSDADDRAAERRQMGLSNF